MLKLRSLSFSINFGVVNFFYLFIFGIILEWFENSYIVLILIFINVREMILLSNCTNYDYDECNYKFLMYRDTRGHVD